jgi:aerobic carbon-monoxide dehydrogenase large subunit
MRLVGAKVPRVEDQRILTGHGHYVDDVHLPRMSHAVFLRSPFAHAAVTAVDISAAEAAPGVAAVLTGSALAEMIKPMPVSMAAGSRMPQFHALAVDRVRFAGDPVAIVVAETRREAEDAAELIDISYEPLPAVTTYEAALAPDSPQLFEELPGNVQAEDSMTFGDIDGAFSSADRVIALTFRQHRVAPVPIETRGAVAEYDHGSGELTYHCNSQAPHGLRLALAETLEIAVERVQVLTKDIGGAFGLKSCFGREEFALAAVARLLGRPVKWTEDRYEHLVASGQAREEKMDVEVAVANDGTLLGLRANMTLDQGAYPGVPFPADTCTRFVQALLPGPYRWRAYDYRRTVLVSNKCTYLAYRGPWEMETWVRERVLDEVAHELGLDPAEIRRRNMVDGEPNDKLITGLSLAGVSSRESLDLALDLIGYDDFRRDQEVARAEGRCIGVGFATFIEAAPGPLEMRLGGGAFGGEEARVKLESDGHLTVVTSQVPQGQSHETTLAQVAADEMGVPFEHVKVVHGDTRLTPFKIIGTAGSMSATWASGAVLASTRKVKEKVLAIAAELLEIGPADLEIVDGVISPRGVPSKAIPLAELAMQATMAPGSLPPGTDALLEAQERFRGEGITGSGWSGGTHVCTVEIDLETGRVTILRYLVTEDCGRVINPAVVEGQVRGGVAQGIGEVLYELAAYDEDGNFLASTFMDYLLPTCAEIPPIEIHHMETDPDGEFGARGVGEGGAIVAPAALTNAIADALAPFGARVSDQYLPPAKVLELAGVIDASP